MTRDYQDRAPSSVAGDVERVPAEEGLVNSPQPTFQSTLPSGIEVRFFTQDKEKKIRRHYEVRRTYPDDRRADEAEGYEGSPGLYADEWVEVPSVSSVLFKDPNPLIWWGQKIGIRGTLELFRRGLVRASKLQDGSSVLSVPGRLADGSAGLLVAGDEEILSLMKRFEMTTNDQVSEASERGQSAHDALELWARGGAKFEDIPDPEAFPPDEQGYIVGLRMFLEHLHECEPEVIASERLVASVEHGFAGRFDLEIKTHRPGQVVKRWQPKRGPKWATLPPGIYVPDLKTSKSVYDEHFIQLEGYELGRIESGYEPSVARGIIHVHPGDPNDSKQPDTPYYEFVPAKKEPEVYRRAFLASLALHNALEAI